MARESIVRPEGVEFLVNGKRYQQDRDRIYWPERITEYNVNAWFDAPASQTQSGVAERVMVHLQGVSTSTSQAELRQMIEDMKFALLQQGSKFGIYADEGEGGGDEGFEDWE